MENAQKLTWRIWESKGMGRALLIGGLLAYVPIINLLLLGYYGQWIRQLVRGEGMELPDWADWRQLVRETLVVLIPVLVWGFLPTVLALILVWALAGILAFLHLGFFAVTVAWLPMALALMFVPVAVSLSLIRLYSGDSLRPALDPAAILHGVLDRFRDCLFPLFQYYGILVLGWPLIGFAAFLAVLPLHAQLVLVFRKSDEDLKSL